MKISRRFVALFRKAKLEADMAEELRLHLEVRTRENVAAGMPPEEARYAALRKFGGVEQAKEIARAQRAGVWLDQLAQDFRYALRQLRQHPGFATVAVLSLALGIGANTAIFSLVDEVLLKMLPVRKPEELVLFHWAASPRGGYNPNVVGDFETDPKTKVTTSTSFSRRAFETFVAQNQTLSAVFAFAPLWQPTLIVQGEPEAGASVQLVSGGYHAGLGVPAHLGRLLSSDDDRPGAPAVAVISHRYWQNRFGGDRAAVGQSLVVNRLPATIVGVTPPDFQGTLDVGVVPDVSLPLELATQVSPGVDGPAAGPVPMWWLRIMGRRAEGRSREQVRGNLSGVFQALVEGEAAALRSRSSRPPTAEALGLPTLVVGEGRRGLNMGRQSYAQRLTILAGLVGMVLVIACANVANLLLARGAARRRELAARLALGAGRGRIIRQLLTESGVLAALGAAAGVLLAYWGKGFLLSANPLATEGGEPLVLSRALDLRVLGFTTAIAGLTGMLCGLVPALRATRIDLTAEFQGGARTVGGGSRSWLAKTLMAAQVALSLVMLVGAALFVRTLHNLESVDVGFNRERLLLFSINPVSAGHDRAQTAVVHTRIVETLAGVPGVRAATYSWMPLLSRAAANMSIFVEGRPQPAGGRPDSAMFNSVGPDFFSTLEIPVVVGRAFTARDDASAPKVAVINETMARTYFPEQNPVGRRFGRGRAGATRDIEIVGVVRDAKYSDVKVSTPPTAYVPYAQSPMGEGSYAVRTIGEPERITAAIRAAVRRVDPALPMASVRTQAAQIEKLFATERLFARFAGFFGILALGLVCVGLYGLLSYAVTRRTNEIGVRMALGADRCQVLGLMMRDGMMLITTGVVAGLVLAFWLTRFVRAHLFQLSPTDPSAFAASAFVLVLVGLAACLLPARRAAKIDPMVALRSE